MPVATYIPGLIELAVSDRIQDDTIIKQKVRFVSLLHSQDQSGVCVALIRVLVFPFSAAAGDFGAPLTGPYARAYETELVADNQTLVDAATGEIVAIRYLLTAEQWQDMLASERQTMLQGDFFHYLRENADVRIGDMIRQHIAQANAMGRFA